MKIYPVNKLPDYIMVGRQTEYGVTDIRIDCAPWLSLWPDMNISVWVTPPGGDAAYPAATHMEGDVLVWPVNEGDTAKAGVGRMEIMGLAEGKKKLSAVTTTRVLGTTTSTTAEPPEAVRAWVDSLVSDCEEAAKQQVEEALAEIEGAGSSGGSAGGSTSKYKQPEWGADTAIVDILPETEFTIMSADEPYAVMMSPMPYSLIEGDTYEVIYNGTSYNCVCYFQDDGTGGGDYTMGNMAAAGMEGYPETDAPFVFGYYHEKTAAENGFYGMILPLDGSTTFTLSIKGEDEVIHTIPAAYVENAYVLNVNLKMDYSAADKTYDEIMAAINAGKIIRLCVKPDDGTSLAIYPTFSSVDLQSRICFTAYAINGTICCKPDNTWGPYNT